MQITHFNAQGSHRHTAGDLAGLLAVDSGMVWVDFSGPAEDDVRLMREVFNFHPMAIEDSSNQEQRPKIEEYPGYLFMIVNAVTIVDEEPDFRELDIFVGRNYIVTVHAGDEPVIETTRNRLSVGIGGLPIDVGYLLYVLLDVTVDSYFPIMDMIEDEIDALEDAILRRPQQHMIARLFELKHLLIRVWRAVWPQRDIISKLSQPHILAYSNASQDAVQYYMRDVSDHLLWLADMVNTFRDMLTSMIDLYMSAVSNRLNRVVNRLTIITVSIGLLTVISGFYGMNYEQTWPPFVEPLGVPFVLMLMLSIAGGLLLLFRKLRWY